MGPSQDVLEHLEEFLRKVTVKSENLAWNLVKCIE